MAKEERLLHKSNNNGDNPIYVCGDPIPENRKMITDAQAMALRTCPKCFPKGFKGSGLIAKKDEGSAWL